MKDETSTNRAPRLQTGRLELLPLSEADVDALHRVSNEPPVRRYLWDDEPVTRAFIEEMVARSTRTFSKNGVGLFGVRRRGMRDLLGICGFVRLGGMEEPELGYELTQEAWGKGLATEASLACLRYAFEEAGLERAIAGADALNVASLRVIQKLGMRPAGNINPEAPEVPYYAMNRDDFVRGASALRA
ncbi:MAG: GNAT family N-acetyltransferase [Rubrobacter sp.]